MAAAVEVVCGRAVGRPATAAAAAAVGGSKAHRRVRVWRRQATAATAEARLRPDIKPASNVGGVSPPKSEGWEGGRKNTNIHHATAATRVVSWVQEKVMPLRASAPFK